MTNKQFMDWLHNPQNICNCENCIYNMDNTASRYPCGQQNCWVEVHCDRAAELDAEQEDDLC